MIMHSEWNIDDDNIEQEFHWSQIDNKEVMYSFVKSLLEDTNQKVDTHSMEEYI